MSPSVVLCMHYSVPDLMKREKKQFILALPESLTRGQLNVLNSADALFFSCQRKSCSVIRLLGELCLCTVAQTVGTVL